MTFWFFWFFFVFLAFLIRTSVMKKDLLFSSFLVARAVLGQRVLWGAAGPAPVQGRLLPKDFCDHLKLLPILFLPALAPFCQCWNT